jgi:hypothetical protein
MTQIFQETASQTFIICILLWCAIVDNYLTGPYVLLDRLAGENYQRFLQKNTLPELFGKVPIEIR